MFPQTLTGIQLNFTGSARARAIGLYAVALSTGAVAGQLLGGVLISADLGGTGWRPIFLINVPVGVALLVAGWRHLPADVARTSRRLDLRGVAALSAAVMLLVLPLVLGQEPGWPLWSWICLVARSPPRCCSPPPNVGASQPGAPRWSISGSSRSARSAGGC